ncbi:MAG: alanine--tRNA ligase [Coriobacteriia bacterium]|nr:alanine--tRNA ligase [Coriobacteriia bacterium]
MNSVDIREKYLSFFESKGCRRLPSSSLIPDDPSLLLTTAGMVQFKPVFLGAKNLGFTRATTVQKCVRTTDIDIIGTTGRHHSFFEMLGNFSFGDYFKSEACAWAWEFSTGVLGLDPDRLWVSIFEDDDEAENIWINEVGVSADRIVRMGAKDNFWSAGPTGPCGPCSELYYDQGPEVGCGSAECAVGCDCDRFLEYWNLVFMQYDRAEDGTLSPLPKKNIDTGMGLERIAGILQGVRSNFETDILRSLMTLAGEITGTLYGAGEKSDTSLRIIADHARAVTFLIADGVIPSNEGRGYVLRRLLRRGVRHGRLLGVEDAFLVRLVDLVIELMGAAYPEIVEHRDLIEGIVESEEERFGVTLRQGMGFLETELERLANSGGGTLDGNTAFALHDTYGFPFELTAEIAAEKGVAVDVDSFTSAMEAQRNRARAAVKDDSWTAFGGVAAQVAKERGATDFVGYEHDETAAHVIALIRGGERVEALLAGELGEIVLDRTSFYGEQGGQVGDIGTITGDEAVFIVEDTKIAQGVITHLGHVESGTLHVGEDVHAVIDVLRRERIRRNHTATHLLHWALRLVLGQHAKQAGSYVTPERLRFDFTHFEGMTREQLDKVERLVNAKIFENHPVRAYETSITFARESGVTALFGEKYGEFVRVLEIGNFSKELCGGTHIARTTEIGLVKIVSESSVGANLRRIEAVSSFDAYDLVLREEAELIEAADLLKVPRFDTAERVSALLTHSKELQAKEGSRLRAVADNVVDELFGQAENVGYPVVIAQVPSVDAKAMRALADSLRSRLEGGAVFLATTEPAGGTPLLLAAGSDEAVAAGFDAGAVIRAAAVAVKGGGGGKPQMAQAGGKDAAGIDEALRIARETLGAR